MAESQQSYNETEPDSSSQLAALDISVETIKSIDKDLTDIRHDCTNPLTAAIMAIEWIGIDHEAQTIKESAADIEKELKTVHEILRDPLPTVEWLTKVKGIDSSKPYSGFFQKKETRQPRKLNDPITTLTAEIQDARDNCKAAIIDALWQLELLQRELPEPDNDIQAKIDVIRLSLGAIIEIIDQPVPTLNLLHNGDRLELGFHDLDEIIAPIIRSFPGRHIHVAYQTLNLEIEADKDLIARLLTNVIQNADKFSEATDSKDTKSRINITIKEEPYNIVIEVQDFGPGFDEDPKKLFERDYRGTRTKHMEGTGTGLDFCQKVCLYHHGKITAKNNETGQGSTFTITLPYRQTAKKL